MRPSVSSLGIVGTDPQFSISLAGSRSPQAVSSCLRHQYVAVYCTICFALLLPASASNCFTKLSIPRWATRRPLGFFSFVVHVCYTQFPYDLRCVHALILRAPDVAAGFVVGCTSAPGHEIDTYARAVGYHKGSQICRNSGTGGHVASPLSCFSYVSARWSWRLETKFHMVALDRWHVCINAGVCIQ